MVILVVIIGIAIGVSIYQTPAKTAQKAPETVSQPIPKAATAQELLTLVNAERTKVGAKPLVMDERLNQSAQAKAQDMLTRNYFGHNDPEGNRATSSIYGCYMPGENLTQNIYVNDSHTAVAAWIRSKPHYEAMVSTRYELTGFGIADNYIVEHFCDIP